MKMFLMQIKLRKETKEIRKNNQKEKVIQHLKTRKKGRTTRMRKIPKAERKKEFGSR